MNPSIDPSAGSVTLPVVAPKSGWRSVRGIAAFWIVASIGVPILCVGWFVYGFAFFEEMTEACKSIAAGSDPTGIGLVLGVIPLIVAHALVLLPLLLIGAIGHSRRVVGIALAVVAVVAASAVGIAVSELIWTGELFSMSAAAAQCSVIDPL